MPRSPLRQPKTASDYRRWLRVPEELPARLDSDALFGNDRPLEIEIGSGKGLFIERASTAQPEHNFLGIEIAAKYAAVAARRLARGEADNGLMVAGSAEPLMAERVPPASLEAIHVYFPDPWWKKRHRKRRVINQQTLGDFSRALRPGGRFHFWTDVLDYFEQTIELIAEVTPELGVPIPEQESEAEHDLDYHTHFERRSRQQQIPVYRVRYEKKPGQRGGR